MFFQEAAKVFLRPWDTPIKNKLADRYSLGACLAAASGKWPLIGIVSLLSWLALATWNFVRKQKALYGKSVSLTMGPFCFDYGNTLRAQLPWKQWPGDSAEASASLTVLHSLCWKGAQATQEETRQADTQAYGARHSGPPGGLWWTGRAHKTACTPPTRLLHATHTSHLQSYPCAAHTRFSALISHCLERWYSPRGSSETSQGVQRQDSKESFPYCWAQPTLPTHWQGHCEDRPTCCDPLPSIPKRKHVCARTRAHTHTHTQRLIKRHVQCWSQQHFWVTFPNVNKPSVYQQNRDKNFANHSVEWSTTMDMNKWYLHAKPQGFPDGPGGKEPTCQWRRLKRRGLNPWVRKIP